MNINDQPSQLTRTQLEKKDIVKNTVEKEIPAEYQNIQIIFDGLLHKCMELSTTAIFKRKLDDVRKKLEVLYNKLKESSVKKSNYQTLFLTIFY